nr:hypothetical protein [uncultured Mediterranean phage uvMED]
MHPKFIFTKQGEESPKPATCEAPKPAAKKKTTRKSTKEAK